MKKTVAVALSMLAACGDDTCDPSRRDTICTIAGTGEQGLSEDGTPAVDSKLYIPLGTIIGPDGNVWVLDFANYVIRSIDRDGKIRTVVGSGEPGDAPTDGATTVAALGAPLNHLGDMVIHDGYLYLTAWHNSRIKRVNLETMMLENYAGTGRRTYYNGDGGPALDAALDLPASLAFAPRDLAAGVREGDLVFTDQANMVIRRIDAERNVHTIAGSCVIDFITPCEGTTTPTSCPDSHKTVCGDPAMECDYPCIPAFTGDGEQALDARFGWIFGAQAMPTARLVYDRSGNLFVSDGENHRIRRIGIDGVITTVAGTGERGYNGDGPATEVMLDTPVDLAISDAGVLYFTDTNNSCVRKLDAGIVTTVAGVCGVRDFGGDGGSPREAFLDRPYAIDLVGDLLYISDTFNSRVRVANVR